MQKRKERDESWRPKHLSVSAVQLFERCPAAYKHKYIDGTEDSPSAPMLFGRAMAKSLEVAHNGGDALGTFAVEYSKAAEISQKFGNPMFIYPDLGFDVLQLYLARKLVGEPEHQFKIWLPNRDEVPVPIVGYMDLKTPTEIVEFKTSAGGWSYERAEASHQNHVYGYAFREEEGRWPDCVRFIILGTRVMVMDEYIVHPTETGLSVFCDLAAQCYKAVETGVFEFKCGKCDLCRKEKARIKSEKAS